VGSAFWRARQLLMSSLLRGEGELFAMHREIQRVGPKTKNEGIDLTPPCYE
jgi:hypothetical protein